MKRRQFIQTAGASTIGAIAGFSLLRRDPVQAKTTSITLEWLGHTSFLVAGDGLKVLINPYKAIGCTAGYQESFPSADVVLMSSQLFDEGYVDGLQGEPTILWQAGQYPLNKTTFNGISLDHANIERYRGWRFPPNVAWSWQQGGVNILHLGGTGEPVDIEDFILTGGSPDVLILPVGGTDADPTKFPPKGYKPEQALEAIALLKPKVIIPTHYKTAAADDTCLLHPLEHFVNLVDREAMAIANLNTNSIQLSPANLPQTKPEIKILGDRTRLKS